MPLNCLSSCEFLVCLFILFKAFFFFLMWAVFKVFIVFVRILLLFCSIYIFAPLHMGS